MIDILQVIHCVLHPAVDLSTKCILYRPQKSDYDSISSSGKESFVLILAKKSQKNSAISIFFFSYSFSQGH